jgi:putative PIN family toxin of toxin-antitoxin system
MTSAGARPERVVLDTNVLASALAFGGVPASVLDLGKRGAVTICVSRFILEELAAVLASRKIRWTAERIESAIKELAAFMTLSEPNETVDAIKTDDADNRILECGLAAKAAVIVTGNMKDIRPLGSFRGMAILTPREFLDKHFPLG